MELHADIGRLAVSLGVDVLVGIGPLSGATVQAAAGIQAKHFARDDVAAAAAWLVGRLGDEPGAILVKASRGVKLERFLDALAARTLAQT
jgi:UDP-N-acetylmuramoyl-tripeptide--D-alanyl-D-alanine ligase